MELNEIYKRKENFTHDLGELFEKYEILQIHNMSYKKDTVNRETVSFYDGDRKHIIDVSGDSELAILYDIIKVIW